MGPVSTVAIAFLLILVGLTWVAAISASLHLLGIVALVVAAVVLIDTFWHRFARHD